MKLSHVMTDFRLNFRLRRICKEPISMFCSTEKEAKGNETTYESLTFGEVYHCLKKHYTDIELDDCKREVRNVVRIHAQNSTMDPIFVKACKDDLASYCE